MHEQTKLSQIELRVIEYPHRKETCLVKVIDGFETTSIVTRKSWAKAGKQGAWQHCAKYLLAKQTSS